MPSRRKPITSKRPKLIRKVNLRVAAAEALLASEIPDPSFSLALLGEDSESWAVCTYLGLVNRPITLPNADPMVPVLEAVALYQEARNACQDAGRELNHASICTILAGMLEDDSSEPTDYPHVALTREEFDALPAKPETPKPGDVYKALREGGPKDEWYRVTVTKRVTEMGTLFLTHERIDLLEA